MSKFRSASRLQTQSPGNVQVFCSRGSDDMNIPGFRLHPLKGSLTGYWAVSVSGNWRVTFRFDNGDAVDVDYMDYH
jgi:toxin HigB-1